MKTFYCLNLPALFKKHFCLLNQMSSLKIDISAKINCDTFSVAPSTIYDNGTAHLCVRLTYAYRGQLWIGHQNFFVTTIMSINRRLLVWISLQCSKIHFLFNETKVIVVYALKWHYKLPRLFCGALFNNLKCKKTCCSIKKKICSILRLVNIVSCIMK